jgi:hypothetical protein
MLVNTEQSGIDTRVHFASDESAQDVDHGNQRIHQRGKELSFYDFLVLASFVALRMPD